MFLQLTSTRLFQWLQPLPLGRNLFNQYLRSTHSSIDKNFKPYVVNLKPFYCETILHYKRRHRDLNSHIKPNLIMQLCNITFELATLNQDKFSRSRHLTHINFQLFKPASSQISAICDLQEDKTSLNKSFLNKVQVEVQDTNGDRIALAKFILNQKE